jgi:hypothetical protein
MVAVTPTSVVLGTTSVGATPTVVDLATTSVGTAPTEVVVAPTLLMQVLEGPEGS